MAQTNLHDKTTSPAVARLMAACVPTAPGRAWCVLSDGWKFDGGEIAFDGTAEEREQLMALIDRSMEEDFFVIWTPSEKRQKGSIPRSLRCGFTVFRDGDDLICFQSVVFAPLPGAIDLVATTRTGQYVTVRAYDVSSWDGTSIGDARLTAMH
jgi:hypothetical protein